MKTKAHLTDQPTERERRNRLVAFQAATEGMVLLENDGTLPVQPCRIALYGAGAQYTLRGGSGSGEVNVRHTVSVYEGLKDAGFEIATDDWLERYDRQWKEGKERFLRSFRRRLLWPNPDLISEMMAAEYRFPSGDRLAPDEPEQTGADTCFYVVARQSGEGHDREDLPGSFRLDDTEIHNIRLCAAHFKRFVLIINAGAPVDLSPLDGIEGVNAVLYMGQPGMEAGSALAAVLTGQCNPSGRLALTWPKTYGDVPFAQDFARDPDEERYAEGIYVGYRYYDSFGVTPRYPFGFGRSYTTFALTPSRTQLHKDRMSCTVDVTNTGARAGKEVVQLYVRCPGEDREYQRLAAFAKTDELTPGQTQAVDLSFPLSTLSYYDEADALTMLAQGAYLLLTGNSSRNTQPVAVIRLNTPVVLCRHRHLCAAGQTVAQLHHANDFAVPDNLPEWTLNPDDFVTEEPDYTDRPAALTGHAGQLMDKFGTDDCIRFCAGAGFAGEKKGFRTPGAVGFTTAAYLDKGVPNIQMCDGPAGIRLEKRAVLYPDGNIKPLDLSISLYEFLPRFLLRWFVLGNPDKGQMLYQFVTGFPIEAMMAQTWNTPLAEQVGAAVSEEMTEYGVTFWLAPAMNIVRNPLCGRNYEYYSEDPLLSGLMAASVTRGVQAQPGNYVTLKHFCANNQESNRQHVSSSVDERVLREIYWKGFEIAVKESAPRAVMAAYNKLNGIYCTNNRELCTGLLRGEWRFDGIVMTDWMATGKGKADEAAAIRAGVDLLMPGGEDDLKALTRAARDTSLPEEDIRRAAARVLQLIV